MLSRVEWREANFRQVINWKGKIIICQHHIFQIFLVIKQSFNTQIISMIIMSEQSFSTKDANVILKEGEMFFDKNLASYARFWLRYDSMPEKIKFEDIEKVWLDDFGVGGIAEIKIEHSGNETRLRVNDLGALRKISNSIDGVKEAKRLVKEIKERTPDYEQNLDKEKTKDKQIKGNHSLELKRTCKACGNVWHIEKDEIENLRRKKKQNKAAGALTALTGNLAASSMSNKNQEDAKQKLKNLNKCPECRSSKFEEEEVSY